MQARYSKVWPSKGLLLAWSSANIVKVKDEEATKSHEKNIYSSGAKAAW